MGCAACGAVLADATAILFCRKCQQASYCGEACRLKDAPRHAPSCKDGPVKLSVSNPLSDIGVTHPDAWGRICHIMHMVCTTGTPKILMISGSNPCDVELLTRQEFVVKKAITDMTALLNTFDNRTRNQVCVIVMAADGTYYFTRMSVTAVPT